MNNAPARALLRRAIAQPRPGRAYACSIGPLNTFINAHGVSYNVARARTLITVATTAQPRSALSPDLPRSLRAFHSTPIPHKVKKKGSEASSKSSGSSSSSSSSSGTSSSGSAQESSEADESGSKHPKPSPEEPLNFADVQSRLAKHAEHFRSALKKMHTAGRFDPEVVGGIKVTVDKKSNTVYPLRELAQVVPRGGRTVSLLVHDEEYVKPIMSAVQSSPDFNQQPQRDADNELELVLKVEAEKPEDVVRRVKAVAHEWRERVQGVRQKRDKLHETWKKGGLVGPDLKRTADKELQKVIKEAADEVNTAEKAALKVVQP
ncbi:ribosome recycling factor [Xylaria sp. CBS 124048]|nr:ribosome recycling factor [Xylaria sp. CBS 124048]